VNLSLDHPDSEQILDVSEDPWAITSRADGGAPAPGGVAALKALTAGMRAKATKTLEHGYRIENSTAVIARR
jgi:hypothetical protein